MDVGVRNSVVKMLVPDWLSMVLVDLVLGTDFGDLLHSSDSNLNQNEYSGVGALPGLWPADLSTADQAPQN